MDETMKGIKEGKGLPPLDKETQCARNGVRVLPIFKRKVVLEAFIQIGYEQYTHLFKTVDIELPDDGIDWHVAGEVYDENRE